MSFRLFSQGLKEDGGCLPEPRPPTFFFLSLINFVEFLLPILIRKPFIFANIKYILDAWNIKQMVCKALSLEWSKQNTSLVDDLPVVEGTFSFAHCAAFNGELIKMSYQHWLNWLALQLNRKFTSLRLSDSGLFLADSVGKSKTQIWHLIILNRQGYRYIDKE